jgi:hypothetical protein
LIGVVLSVNITSREEGEMCIGLKKCKTLLHLLRAE